MSLALCRFMPKTSESMHQEQRDKTHQLLRQTGIHQALFAHPGNVTWLTGMPHPWELLLICMQAAHHLSGMKTGTLH